MRVRLAKWGNSMAVRLPRDVVEQAGLADGQELEVEARDGVVSLRATKPRYTLEALLASMPPGAEEPELIDWGPDRGSEILPEDDYSRGLITEADILRRRT